MPNRISRACDACRLRKVRCNGALPCSQCAHLDLKCEFPTAPVKRKPPVRGRLVAQLKEKGHQEEHNPASTAASSDTNFPHVLALPEARWAGGGLPPVTSIAGIVQPADASSYQSKSIMVIDGLGGVNVPEPYSQAFFAKLIPEFEEVVYPMNPIITSAEMREAINDMYISNENAALVYAYGAVTINLTRTSWHLQGDVVTEVKDLLQKALTAHRLVDTDSFRHGPNGIFNEMPVSVKRIVTCLYMEISLMAFKRHDRAFALLREASSMAQWLQLGKSFQPHQEPPQAAPELTPWEVSRRQRLYWEVYIHERFFTMVTGCPSILEPLGDETPLADTTIPPNIDLGWRRLVHLFKIIDSDFLAYWNHNNNNGGSGSNNNSSINRTHDNTETSHPPFTTPLHTRPMQASWVENKQAELDADELGAQQEEQALFAAGKGGFTEFQHVDLFITRLWLRTLVWELALRRNLLSTTPRGPHTHESLSVHYPTLRLSSQLRSLVSRLGSVASVGTHGSGILQKLFDITTTVASVLSLPFRVADEGAGRAGEGGAVTQQWRSEDDLRTQLEDFVYLVRFLFQFERIEGRQRRYLRSELDKLQSRYFGLVDFEGVMGENVER